MSRASRKKRFATIALMGNADDARVAETIDTLARHLAAGDHAVEVSNRFAGRGLPKTIRRVAESRLAKRADLVISIGGDGSMLYAARRLASRQIPLVGINRGRLGFLADVGPEDMVSAVDEILAGRYLPEQRMLLEAELLNGRRVVARGLALNDVVIKRQNAGRMLEYEIFLDGRYVNTHLGDGLIVATPTGSTAYALSCGGPIVEPGLAALVLAPICPHTLSERPIVVPAERIAEIRLREEQVERAEVTCDGEVVGQLGAGWTLRVSTADVQVQLIHPTRYDYYATLRSKLHWGGRNSRGHPATAERMPADPAATD